MQTGAEENMGGIGRNPKLSPVTVVLIISISNFLSVYPLWKLKQACFYFLIALCLYSSFFLPSFNQL
jgi:hypothetical protein